VLAVNKLGAALSGKLNKTDHEDITLKANLPISGRKSIRLFICSIICSIKGAEKTPMQKCSTVLCALPSLKPNRRT